MAWVQDQRTFDRPNDIEEREYQLTKKPADALSNFSVVSVNQRAPDIRSNSTSLNNGIYA